MANIKPKYSILDKRLKNFYGTNVEDLETEINEFINTNSYILDRAIVTYLPDPEKNPNRTFLLFTIIFHEKYKY
jgi:hypothetical protein